MDVLETQVCTKVNMDEYGIKGLADAEPGQEKLLNGPGLPKTYGCRATLCTRTGALSLARVPSPPADWRHWLAGAGWARWGSYREEGNGRIAWGDAAKK